MFFERKYGCAFTAVTAAAVTLLPSLSGAAPHDVRLVQRQNGLKFDYNANKVRGVNLGGWFVLEPWITPSMFQVGGPPDEYTLCQSLGPDEAHRRLSAHWDSWITQDDFHQIAAAGLNHVRIPIGYWSIEPSPGDPYVKGAYEKLATALDWAKDAGLKVVIDLHGAPGSQNGFDNSGRNGSIDWTKGDTIQHSLNVITRIRDDHAAHPAVAAIELVNEPMGPKLDMNVIRQSYTDGWYSLKNAGVATAFHDAFQEVSSWNTWGGGMEHLVEDTHHYEVFSNDQVGMNIDDHVRAACNFGNNMTASNKITIAGEFTGGITDCAKWLNGLGRGARYDGTFDGEPSIFHGSCEGKSTGSVAALSEGDKNDISRFVEAQLDAFERAGGWIFWTWKTEAAPEWDMKQLLANGLFPQPLSARKHPNQCG